MANEDVGGGGGNWWDSWVNAAKAKSAEVYEFVKRDFDEISSVVKNEASAVVNSTASVVKETLQLDKPDSTVGNMKRSVSSFLGQVGNVLNPLPDDGDEEAILIQGDNHVFLNRLQTRVYALASDPSTFTKEIDNDQLAQFDVWLSVLEEDKMTDEKLSKMLAANKALQENYDSLVPHQVSHLLFWQRFLFRKGLIEDEEAARERREEREKSTIEQFDWDKEESLSDHIELTEEEQTQILSEYEKERKLLTETKKVEKEEYNNSQLIEKERKDMVIVSTSATNSVSTSSGDKESNDDDWEREFDLFE